jgi:hypothetical protein
MRMTRTVPTTGLFRRSSQIPPAPALKLAELNPNLMRDGYRARAHLAVDVAAAPGAGLGPPGAGPAQRQSFGIRPPLLR